MDNRRALFLLLFVTILPSCASYKAATAHGPLSFLNTYDSARNEYEHGHIMEARATVLHMNRDKPGYNEAQKLLKEKIEPARRRLLSHYTRQAREAEHDGIWFKAKDLYTQAASFSIRNDALLKKAGAMDLKMRQVRLDTIISRRRKEDAVLMAWLNGYAPPRQLDPQDEPFVHSEETLRDWIDDRAHNAYVEAKRNLRLGYPEVAYADIESYLRFEPDSSFGLKLMRRIEEALPKGLRIPSESTRIRRHPVRHTVKQPPPAESQTFDEQDIRRLIKQKQWLKAYRAVQIYRREGGKGADRLFQEVDARMEKEAAAAFKAGRVAFRAEDIDTAVKQWRRAVALRPDNVQYSENLHRAEQLQERLRILRSRSE